MTHNRNISRNRQHHYIDTQINVLDLLLFILGQWTNVSEIYTLNHSIYRKHDYIDTQMLLMHHFPVSAWDKYGRIYK